MSEEIEFRSFPPILILCTIHMHFILVKNTINLKDLLSIISVVHRGCHLYEKKKKN